MKRDLNGGNSRRVGRRLIQKNLAPGDTQKSSCASALVTGPGRRKEPAPRGRWRCGLVSRIRDSEKLHRPCGCASGGKLLARP